jgi:nucleoid-associated protein YgaU
MKGPTMPTRFISYASVLLSLVLTSGCSTLSFEDRSLLTGMQTDIDNLGHETRKVSGLLEGIEVRQTQLRADVRAIEDKQAGSRDAVDRKLAAVDARIKAVDTARQKDRAAIVSELSDKMAKVINAQRASTPSEYGYEHTVQVGETLSAIAAHYGASVDAIVAANKLKNANAIRAGQKLMVPK